MHFKHKLILLFSGLVGALCLSLTIHARLIECVTCGDLGFAVSGAACSKCQKESATSAFNGKAYTDKFNQLAYVMFRQACKDEVNKNRVISNHSIVSMLTLLALGSSGKTSQQLAEYLQVEEQHIPALWQWLEKGFIAADPGLAAQKPKSAEIFTGNNVVLVREDHELQSVFQRYMSKYLPTAILKGGINWQTSDALVAEVNGAINNTTRGFIPRCLDRESLCQQNPAITLLNAIYLQAPWAEAFRKIKEGGTFFVSDSVSPRHEVHMMNCLDEETTRYGKHDGWEVVEKGCGYCEHFQMVMMLPPKGIMPSGLGLDKFNEILNNTVDQDRGNNKWNGYEINLTMPAFKMRAEANLREVLPPFVFSADACLDSLLKSSGAWVDEMNHQAVVRVDEGGVAAAAVTSSICSDGGAKMYDGYVEVTLDRPFLYLIRHIPTKSVIFIGQLCDPSKARL